MTLAEFLVTVRAHPLDAGIRASVEALVELIEAVGGPMPTEIDWRNVRWHMGSRVLFDVQCETHSYFVVPTVTPVYDWRIVRPGAWLPEFNDVQLVHIAHALNRAYAGCEDDGDD
jgi:hypothetical protein